MRVRQRNRKKFQYVQYVHHVLVIVVFRAFPCRRSLIRRTLRSKERKDKPSEPYWSRDLVFHGFEVVTESRDDGETFGLLNRRLINAENNRTVCLV
jgi:hypothetical protein